MFKTFVTGDKHQHFKFFINEMTSASLEYSPSNIEKSFVSKFKTDHYFFQVSYHVFSCVMTSGSSTSTQSIFATYLKSNEQSCQYCCTSVCWRKRHVNKSPLVSLSFCQYLVDDLC